MNTRTHRYRFFLAWIMAASGFISCEKIIDISIPDKERKIVINGLVSAGQPIAINLSRSLSVLERDSLTGIRGALVNLYHGTDLIGKFEERPWGYYTLPEFLPEVGQTYRLTASAGTLNQVEASATLPPLVPIQSVDTATLTGEWGQRELRLSIKFKDPAGVKNIYGFGVNVTYKDFDFVSMTYTGRKRTDRIFLYGNTDRFLKDESTNMEGKLYFEDLLFDGQAKTIEFGVSDFSYLSSDTLWLTVNMEQIDRSYYLYVLSYNAYQQAHGNPFAEPVQVYTNVTAGYGIFGGVSSDSTSLVIPGRGKFR